MNPRDKVKKERKKGEKERSKQSKPIKIAVYLSYSRVLSPRERESINRYQLTVGCYSRLISNRTFFEFHLVQISFPPRFYARTSLSRQFKIPEMAFEKPTDAKIAARELVDVIIRRWLHKARNSLRPRDKRVSELLKQHATARTNKGFFKKMSSPKCNGCN
ncbi:hypothetical protein PUN28_007294 [Cardiocondyla obscurior]|uniref:Uncharacterized protein n=1 Tax=Cardiocondyla obscurior TaxID=286306 RepID=A0AAW2G7G8_9HYME